MQKPSFFKDNMPDSPFFYLTLGVVLCFGLFSAFFSSMPAPSGVISMIDRIAYTLQWHSLTALFILYVVFRITMIRLMAATISVENKEKGRELEEQLRTNYEILTNSIEQGFIFFIASMGATTVLSLENFKAVPICIMLFFIGRGLFFYGYMKHPRYRTVGMPFSFILNGGLLVIVLQHLMTLDLFK